MSVAVAITRRDLTAGELRAAAARTKDARAARRILAPEQQPAETLWVHVDEPIVNKHFETIVEIDTVVAERCVALANDRDLVRGQAGVHWWPNQANPT